MKKITAIALILLSSAAFTAPVHAIDNLTLKGDYYFRGRLELNRYNREDHTDDRELYHQRIRTHFFYQVLEEVKIQLRADWNEGAWGDDVDRSGVPDTTKDYKRAIQIERALVQFVKPKFDATLGLQQSDGKHAFGLDYVYKPQAAGLSVQLRLPLTVDVSYYKYSEGYSDDDSVDILTDDKALNSEDTDLYGGQISYKSEKANVGIYYAAQNDRQTGDNPQVASLWGSMELGSIFLGLEGDYFFGDNGEGSDYIGNQLYLDAAFTISENYKIGAHGYYALGSDAADEEVLNQINVWGPWVPSISYGMPGFTWDGIEGLAGVHNFNAIGDNAGQIGGDAYFNAFLGDFEIGVQGYYFVPQEKDATEKESKYGFCGGAAYTWKKKVILALGALYTTPVYDDDREDKASIGAQSAVRVKF